LGTKPDVSLGVPLTKPIDALRTYFKTGFPEEHIGKQAAAHANSAVNAPDRQVYPLLVQGLFPSENVLVDAINQGTIQVEEENGFDA
jgi:hypothetical protein